MNRGAVSLALTGAVFLISAAACTPAAQPAASATSSPAQNDSALQRAIRAAHPTLMQQFRISQIMHDKQVAPGARADLIQAIFTTEQRKRFLAALASR